MPQVEMPAPNDKLLFVTHSSLGRKYNIFYSVRYTQSRQELIISPLLKISGYDLSLCNVYFFNISAESSARVYVALSVV